MSLSEDESEYIDLIRDRATRQIDSGVWEGIQRDRLNGWMGSLKNIDAELLGAYFLDNLCYRSRAQYNAMLDALFLNLPTPGAADSELLIDTLRAKAAARPSCGVRLAPVIGHSAPPTKSGPYILRLVQRRFQLHSDWLVWPHLLSAFAQINGNVFSLNDTDVEKLQGTQQLPRFARLVEAREGVCTTEVGRSCRCQGNPSPDSCYRAHRCNRNQCARLAALCDMRSKAAQLSGSSL